MDMKRNFNEIADTPQHFKCDNTGWFRPVGIRGVDGVVAHYSLTRKNNDVVILTGGITGTCIASCDRCGQDASVVLDTDFSYTITTQEEVVSELQDVEYDFEDVMTVYSKEPVVDVEAILVEQAELSVPLQILCKENCKGLCPRCGVILDMQECQCSPDYSNSPFAALKKLSQR